MRSTPQSFLAALGVMGGIALVVVIGVLALGPGSTETEVFPDVTLGDPSDLGASGASPAVVVGKHKSGGTSLFGLRFGRETYRLSVQFFTSPGCWPLVDFGDRWPAPFDECLSDVAVEGQVTGLGNAPTGESIVAVDVEVVRDCFDGVTAGASWPPDTPACLDDT
jgi:hypothetical protein